MTALDVLFIAAASIISTLVSEAISWFFVYRKESYQKNLAKLQAAKDKLDDARRFNPTKVAKLKEELKALRTSVGAGSNVFSMGAIAVTMYLIYNFMGRMYGGVTVAKLPFVPLPIVQGFTHFNLVGSDYTDCSFMFLFMLCSVGLRPNVQKFLGVEPPPSPWSQPDDE